MLWWPLLLSSASATTDWLRPLSWEECVLYSGVSLALVLFAGVMSGLTVGMFSIDKLSLEVQLANGTLVEQHQARRLLPILRKHHWLLVTLLMGNTIAMETLPLMLDEMLGELLSILVSVTFVFIFGEVLPQALCTGPNQLGIAIRLLPIVKVVLIIFSPIAYPLSKLLDSVLGSEECGSMYSKEDLKTFIGMYQDTNAVSIRLESEQIDIVRGVIDLEYQRVEMHMIPFNEVFCVRETDPITQSFVARLTDAGYSRVPVLNSQGTQVIGLLKTLYLLGNKRTVTVRNARFKLLTPVFVTHGSSVLYAFDLLRDQKARMAIIRAVNGSMLGILTTEDIMNQTICTGLAEARQHSYLMRRLSAQFSHTVRLGSQDREASLPLAEGINRSFPGS